MSRKYLCFLSVCCAVSAFWPLSTARATELRTSDEVMGFGHSVSLSGDTAIVGIQYGGANYAGSVYGFRNLNEAENSREEDLELSFIGGAGSAFGYSVSVSGNAALVGAVGENTYIGAAYLYRSLDEAGTTKTHDVKLTVSDGQIDDFFGYSVSLSGNTAVVGASSRGSVFVFRNLNEAGANKVEDATLINPNGRSADVFGSSVSLSGNAAVVGAYGTNNSTGAVYLFHNLDEAEIGKTPDAKLSASDAREGDHFGNSVSMSGNMALVGAFKEWRDEVPFGIGAAYLFRNLDEAGPNKTQDVKLTASDGPGGNSFGGSVSLSENTAIVGAHDANAQKGAAYLFRNLDQAETSKTEDVKLTASDGETLDYFGYSVSLDGDNFVIAAFIANGGQEPLPGKAYLGSVSSFTSLDEGNSSRLIAGLSFESRGDWIIGEVTDQNSVTLSFGDTGEVLFTGKAVHVGKTATSDDNTLTIDGALTTNEIHVGATGNSGNALQINGTVTANDVFIAAGSSITGDGTLDGDLTFLEGALLKFNASITLTITGEVTFASSFGVGNLLGLDSSVAEGSYTLINGTSTDFSTLNLNNWGRENAFYLGGGKYAFFKQGSLVLEVVPEPGTYALLIMGCAAVVSHRLRRKVA